MHGTPASPGWSPEASPARAGRSLHGADGGKSKVGSCKNAVPAKMQSCSPQSRGKVRREIHNLAIDLILKIRWGDDESRQFLKDLPSVFFSCAFLGTEKRRGHFKNGVPLGNIIIWSWKTRVYFLVRVLTN